MEIKVYGKENCLRCERIKYYLNERHLPYEYIQDKKELMIIASKSRIMSAPVIVMEEKAYSFEDFVKVVD